MINNVSVLFKNGKINCGALLDMIMMFVWPDDTTATSASLDPPGAASSLLGTIENLGKGVFKYYAFPAVSEVGRDGSVQLHPYRSSRAATVLDKYISTSVGTGTGLLCQFIICLTYRCDQAHVQQFVHYFICHGLLLCLRVPFSLVIQTG